MISANQKLVVISDFDGTIAEIDFFKYVVQNYLDETDLQPWRDYKAGKSRHFESLAQIFAKVRMPQQKFNDDILRMPVDEYFAETVKFCKDKDIRFYIISAGADYYIDMLLEHYGVYDDVVYFANKSHYNEDQGLVMQKLEPGDMFYHDNFSLDKEKIVRSIKNNNTYVVYAGDGDSDIEPALQADKIFAKDVLLDYCRNNKVEAEAMENYKQVLDFLRSEYVSA